ncbi:MAG TPA: 5'-nucleotidase C-terminal domain-containing protein [Gemmatimonadales bacterium]|nr:5'-nucleotidase C-terminal domain-containing protein [Gemmatimonadales bacterium]
MPILALLAGLALAPVDTVRIVVVATADIQGEVSAWDYLDNAPSPGGLARAATVIDSLRTAYPGQVLLVDAGGALSGSPLAAYYGRQASPEQQPIVDAMNLLAYDVATPGDEDFDFGADRFDRAVAGASFRWVSANLRVLPVDTTAFAPFVVIERRGVRIAVTGFTTPRAMVVNAARLRGRYRVDRIEPAIDEVLRGMRDNADVAIVLSHSGLGGPSSYDTTGRGGENVAAAFAAGRRDHPDLVVVGHADREIIDSVVAGVHFVAPLPRAASLAVVHLTLVSGTDGYRLAGIRAERVSLARTPPAERLVRRFAEAHATLQRWASTGIAEATGRFSLAVARVADSPLMGLLHDAVRRATGADLDALPAIELRAAFGPGAVTNGQLYRVYPGESALRVVRVSGEQLKEYLEQAARYFYVDSLGRVFPNRFVPGDDYDLLGGATYAIDLSKPMGSRITGLTVRNHAVAGTDSFSLAITDARQQGEGNYGMLARVPVLWDRGLTVREALLAEVSRRKLLKPEDEPGGFSLTPPELAASARARFVRETGPSPAAAPEPGPVLPLAQTEQERRARDSVERAQARLDSLAAVAVATVRLPAAAGRGEAVGRLLADAYRNETDADVAVVLPREATAPLPAGRLSAAEIRAVASGDDTLLTIKLTGRELKGLLENALAQREPCCEFSGIRVDYDPRSRPWDRVRRTELVASGKPIDAGATYLVGFSTALVDGDTFALAAGDCAPPGGCRKPGTLSQHSPHRLPQRAGDALVDYLRKLPQPVTPPDDQRLRVSR